MFRRTRKGAATTEYILILAIALAIVLLIFWQSLAGIIGEKLSELGVDVPILRRHRPEKKSDPKKSEADPSASDRRLSGNSNELGSTEQHLFDRGPSGSTQRNSTTTSKSR